jgi:hypothetical protein
MAESLDWKRAFWSFVERAGPTECWLWKGWTGKNNYGRFGSRGKSVIETGERLAHRIAFVLNNGFVPPGKIIMHTCNNSKCVNPNHLICGTYQDNSLYREKCGRRWKYRKLSQEKVDEIRRLFKTGHYSTRVLAETFGICRSYACRIVSGERRRTAST